MVVPVGRNSFSVAVGLYISAASAKRQAEGKVRRSRSLGGALEHADLDTIAHQGVAFKLLAMPSVLTWICEPGNEADVYDEIKKRYGASIFGLP